MIGAMWLGMMYASAANPELSTLHKVKIEHKNGLQVTANEALWNRKERSVVLTGDVSLKQHSWLFQAASMKLFFTKQNQLSRVLAQQKVRLQHELGKAKAEAATWEWKKQQITLQGSPLLESKDGQFRGGKIIILLESDEIRCTQGCSLVLSEPRK